MLVTNAREDQLEVVADLGLALLPLDHYESSGFLLLFLSLLLGEFPGSFLLRWILVLLAETFGVFANLDPDRLLHESLGHALKLIALVLLLALDR